MELTNRQRRALRLGALGASVILAAQAWRRRDPFDFRGKSVVITGGSRGLGLNIARALADEGARITLVARDETELRRAVDDIRMRQPFADVAPVQGDVRRRYEAERAIAQVIDRFGTVDVLINNAGVIQVGPVDHMTLSDYEDAMATHFWGALYMIMAALPHMRQQGAGRVVNISSIGGKIAVPHLLPYSASKFALAGLSEGLRAELARDNIVVTSVCPGLMRTGSPVNAMFKGRRVQEYAWFAIADSLRLSSIGAERAANQIVRACRYGDAELIITLQAKLAVLARTVAPGLFAGAMAWINELLPAPAERDGDQARPGRDNESAVAGPEQPLTAATYRAAEQNNEM